MPGHEHFLPIFPLYKDVIDLVAFQNLCIHQHSWLAYGGLMDGELFLCKLENLTTTKNDLILMPQLEIDFPEPEDGMMVVLWKDE